MTRIETFHVRGLAGRAEPYSVDLDPRVNVFFGTNGSGKTTLLRLLYSALRNRTNIIAETPVTEATVTFFSHDRNKTYTRTLENLPAAASEDEYEYVYDKDGDLVMVPVRSSRAKTRWKTQPVRNQAFVSRYLSTSRLAVAHAARRQPYSAHEEGPDESQLDRMFAEQVTQLGRTYTNRTLSEVRQIQQSGLAGILQSLFVTPRADHIPNLDAETAFARTNDFLRRQGITKRAATLQAFRKMYEGDSRLSIVVDDIDAIERKIAVAEEPRRRLEELVRSFISQNKHVNFDDHEISVTSDRGQQIPLWSLSSGEKQLLLILVEVVNSGQNTVLIDEPELSMHIDWQRQLLHTLALVNPKAQIVVATHSPEIMADIADHQIHRV